MRSFRLRIPDLGIGRRRNFVCGTLADGDEFLFSQRQEPLAAAMSGLRYTPTLCLGRAHV